jgi:hypothetical protein
VWFDGLPEDAKDEIRDLLGYLEKMTATKWRRPEFDPLEGDSGISELRASNTSSENNGEIKTAIRRIYGFFGPKERKRSYTFLHGAEKIVGNDKNGKRIARERLKRLERGEATVHEFEF